MVRRGQFREDLYYRLHVVHIELPPLRERLDDIAAARRALPARGSARQAARRITRLLARGARARCASYTWPGNVRELRNAVERAIVLGDGEQILPADLPPQVADPARRGPSAPHPLGAVPPPRSRNSPPTPPLGSAISSAALPVVTIDPAPPAAAPTPPRPPPAKSLRELEREGILAALAATGGNKAAAAAILEIDRSTLYKKLKDYGIET